MQAEITVFGSGTSMGVPMLGCSCRTCTSTDPRDTRTRPSILVSYNGHNVLIDTSVEFRIQALREYLTHLDAVFYTHGHADHILGLDDLRPLTWRFSKEDPLPLYADPNTAATIERVFDYTFAKGRDYPTRARVKMVLPEGTAPGNGQWTVDLFGAQFQRVPVMHGNLPIAGYRFGSAAYITDHSTIPAESMPLLQNLDVLIVNALRPEFHPTHSNIENSVALVETLQPRRAFFTHMSHEVLHAEVEAALPPNIRLLYDGLRIPFEI
jgi:phosphoribosyl 1,2-cyclic phosphate phosphodiesterase